LKTAFQCCKNHQNPTKIGRLADPKKLSSLLDQVGLSRFAGNARKPGKMEILAIFNLGRCSMPQNDPDNNPK